MIDGTEADRILKADKSAELVAARWHTTKSPITSQPVRKELLLAVAVDPAPADGELVVIGTWRSPSAIQIRLVLQHGTSESNITRLCVDPVHGLNPHWHHFDQVRGRKMLLEPVSHPPATIDEWTMWADLFVPRMRITDLPGTLVL